MVYLLGFAPSVIDAFDVISNVIFLAFQFELKIFFSVAPAVAMADAHTSLLSR